MILQLKKEELKSILESNYKVEIESLLLNYDGFAVEIETKESPPEYSPLIMEKKKTLICQECGEEFIDEKDAGDHAMKEHHYLFKLKGTNLSLGFA